MQMASKATHVRSETHHDSTARRVESAREAEVRSAPETPADYWLHLQQTIGNQAVQRMMRRSGEATAEPVAVQREDEDEWKFKPLPPELSYNPAGPFNATLSPGGLDLGYNRFHAAGGGSPVDGSWSASLYYGSPLLPFAGDVTHDVNAGYSGLMSGQLGPALTAASTLGSLGTLPTMPFGAGVTASSTPDDPFKLMFGVQGSF
jgi:hypothetical protein